MGAETRHRPRGATVALALLGFALAAVMLVLVPPLALAFGLVLVGVLIWTRATHQDAGVLTPPAAGFLAAVVVYVGLALFYAVG